MDAPMTTEPPTCAPPPEHRDKPWHWLDAPFDLLHRVQWRDGDYYSDLGQMACPETLYELGWRYVAPCVPPPASEGEG